MTDTAGQGAPTQDPAVQDPAGQDPAGHDPAGQRSAAQGLAARDAAAQRSAARRSAAADSRGPRVVVVGGGFAGLAALHALRGSGASVTLVDRNVYSTFQPLLYQVATAGLTSSDVAYPLWSVSRKTGARFHRGLLEGLDTAARVARLDDG